MGCHTWFYRRLDITAEQARKDALYICEEQIKWNQKYIDNPTLNRDWMENDPSNDMFIYAVNYFSRCKRFIEKDIFKTLETLSRFYEFVILDDIYNDRFLDGTYSYELRSNAVYIYTNELPHDTFRIRGYPENQLISLEETLKFCEDNKVGLSLDQVTRLNEFWHSYPDGMIEFG